MLSYLRLRRTVVAVLVVVFVGGLASLPLRQQELYPFYSWFLFALVPQTGTRYSVRVIENGGRPLTPPRIFQEAGAVIPSAHSVTAHKVLLELGEAFQRGDETSIQRLRRHFEQSYLKAPARYELVEVKIDPVLRWKTGAQDVRPLRGFSTGDAAP